MDPNSSADPLCPNWVFSNCSNVHMCKNRGWFTEYTPFESTVGSIYDSSKMPVAGIGTVLLPVKKAPNRSGPNSHGQLVLHDVLYCPSALCNIIGLPASFQYSYIIGSNGSTQSQGSIKDLDGRPVAYFDPKARLFQVRLSGPPVGPVVGPSALKNGLYMLNVRWDGSEAARWEAHKLGRGASTSTGGRFDAPYTDAEKQWLKDHYGGEFRFLRSLGLNMHKDDHREEGRAIARQLMVEDSEDEEDCEIEEDPESEEDLEGHMADYHFDEKTLDWIEKHYGNSMNFMYSFGLKFYDDDDCAEAKQIAEMMIEDDRASARRF